MQWFIKSSIKRELLYEQHNCYLHLATTDPVQTLMADVISANSSYKQ